MSSFLSSLDSPLFSRQGVHTHWVFGALVKLSNISSDIPAQAWCAHFLHTKHSMDLSVCSLSSQGLSQTVHCQVAITSIILLQSLFFRTRTRTHTHTHMPTVLRTDSSRLEPSGGEHRQSRLCQCIHISAGQVSIACSLSIQFLNTILINTEDGSESGGLKKTILRSSCFVAPIAIDWLLRCTYPDPDTNWVTHTHTHTHVITCTLAAQHTYTYS